MDPHPKRRYEDRAQDDDHKDVRRFLLALAACYLFGLIASISMFFFPSWSTLALLVLAAIAFIYVVYKVQEISQRMCGRRYGNKDDDDFGGNHPLPVG